MDTTTAMDPSVDSAIDPSVDSAMDPSVNSAMDPSVDSAMDPSVDSAIDPSVDSAMDPSVDSVMDPPVDSAMDPSVDSAMDPSVDSAMDPSVDSAMDPPVNSAMDPSVNSAMDPPVDSAIDPSVDSAMDPSVDSAMDPSVDSAMDSSVNSAMDPLVNSAMDPSVDFALDPSVDSAMDPLVNSAIAPPVDSAMDPSVDFAIDPSVDSAMDPSVDYAMDPSVDGALKTDLNKMQFMPSHYITEADKDENGSSKLVASCLTKGVVKCKRRSSSATDSIGTSKEARLAEKAAPPHKRGRAPSSKQLASTKADITCTKEDRGSVESLPVKRVLLPRRAGIDWKVGAKLEALDFQGDWYTARIVQIDHSDLTVLIHFDGWSAKFDEWLAMKSSRLRSFSNRKSLVANSQYKTHHQEVKVGTVVLAKWAANKYPAVIRQLLPKKKVLVAFYDGVEAEMDVSAVQHLTPDCQKEALHIWDMMKDLDEGKAEICEDQEGYISATRRRARRASLELNKVRQAKLDAAEGLLTKLREKCSKMASSSTKRTSKSCTANTRSGGSDTPSFLSDKSSSCLAEKSMVGQLVLTREPGGPVAMVESQSKGIVSLRFSDDRESDLGLSAVQLMEDSKQNEALSLWKKMKQVRKKEGELEMLSRSERRKTINKQALDLLKKERRSVEEQLLNLSTSAGHDPTNMVVAQADGEIVGNSKRDKRSLVQLTNNKKLPSKEKLLQVKDSLTTKQRSGEADRCIVSTSPSNDEHLVKVDTDILPVGENRSAKGSLGHLRNKLGNVERKSWMKKQIMRRHSRKTISGKLKIKMTSFYMAKRRRAEKEKVTSLKTSDKAMQFKAIKNVTPTKLSRKVSVVLTPTSKDTIDAHTLHGEDILNQNETRLISGQFDESDHDTDIASTESSAPLSAHQPSAGNECVGEMKCPREKKTDIQVGSRVSIRLEPLSVRELNPVAGTSAQPDGQQLSPAKGSHGGRGRPRLVKVEEDASHVKERTGLPHKLMTAVVNLEKHDLSSTSRDKAASTRASPRVSDKMCANDTVQEPKNLPVGYTVVLEPVDAKPSKAFVVEQEHTQYQCRYCKKSFRKGSLLTSHIKYHHSGVGSASSIDKLPQRHATTICSSDSEIKATSSTDQSTPLDSCTSPIAHSSRPAVREMDSEDEETDDDSITDSEYQCELVNCECGFSEEKDLMIQCEMCMCWQHAQCCQVTEKPLPERHLCFVCLQTPGVRSSCLHLYSYWWRQRGHLSSLLPSADPESGKIREILTASETQRAKLERERTALSSLSRLLTSASQQDNYELALWSAEDEMHPDVVGSGSCNVTERENLLMYVHQVQSKLSDDLEKIESAVSALEAEAKVKPFSPADDVQGARADLHHVVENLDMLESLAANDLLANCP